MAKIDRAAKLRELIASKKTISCPAVYDPISTRLAEAAGFEMLFVSGSSMACTNLGLPDVGVLSYGEYRNILLNMLNVSTLPMIVDIDTGFGGPVTILRTIQEYESMGIAGVMLEDQTFPKRCAYYDGLRVESTDEMKIRIEAALKARTDQNFFLLARTDAAADSTKGFDEALRRAELYHEWGADGVYISTPRGREDIEAIGKLGFPCAVIITEGSATGSFSVADMEEMGIKFVFFAQSLTRACIHTMTKVLNEIKTKGRTDTLDPSMFATQTERAVSAHISKYLDFEKEILKK